MDNKQQNLTDRKLKSLLTGNRTFILGSIIATCIAATPYIFYFYESVPDKKVWNTFLFTYDSQFYNSAQAGVWTIIGKLTPLYLLIIWFFTCRHWWYHALLIPIIMYIFQLVNVINEDLKYVDKHQFKYLIFLMAIIIPSIYLVRARIFNRLNTVDKTIQDLEDELTFKPKTFWGKVKQYF
ncbi:hypothetical protein IEG06_01155 [Olleya marilimosa]|uniref:Uncharacterized protein n=1 Tax=Olleya marilimosa TaxID=272164 RepID=A0ABR8LPA0_9FLAO|nr:hypothetical protein [Olleya marilimosa]MBD3889533.1 hypothetical protein [Olleya marilimosa]|tara:strand:+ start:125795 stop:126337 length:543 start_codon:yes stop_codon:yes gene_type:complete